MNTDLPNSLFGPLTRIAGTDYQNRLMKGHQRLGELIAERLYEDMEQDENVMKDAIWSGDTPGRWLASMSKYRRLGFSCERLAEVADRCMSYQKPTGTFGYCPSPPPGGQIFGDGRLIRGLAGVYQVEGWDRCLESAQKAAEYLESLLPFGHHESDKAWFALFPEVASAAGLPFIDLFETDGDRRWLDVADTIVRGSKIWRRERKGHYHGLLNSARVLPRLYEHTRDESLLEVADWWVEAGLPSVWINGSVAECAPDNGKDETCTIVDWIMLNYDLWRMTGKDRYQETARFSFSNALLSSQLPNGGFTTYRSVEHGMPGTEAHYCCTESGTELLAIAALAALDAEKEGKEAPFPLLDQRDTEMPVWRSQRDGGRSYLASAQTCYVAHEADNRALTEWVRSRSSLRFEEIRWGNGGPAKWRDMFLVPHLTTKEDGHFDQLIAGTQLVFRAKSPLKGILRLEIQNSPWLSDPASPWCVVLVSADGVLIGESKVEFCKSQAFQIPCAVNTILQIEFMPEDTARQLMVMKLGTMEFEADGSNSFPLLADSPFMNSVRIAPSEGHEDRDEAGLWVFPAKVRMGNESLNTELRMTPCRNLWQERRQPKRHGDYGFLF